MEQKLRLIQKLLKAIARSAMNQDFEIDVEVNAGQWNSWTHDGVKSATKNIIRDAAKAFELLEEIKKEGE